MDPLTRLPRWLRLWLVRSRRTSRARTLPSTAVPTLSRKKFPVAERKRHVAGGIELSGKTTTWALTPLRVGTGRDLPARNQRVSLAERHTLRRCVGRTPAEPAPGGLPAERGAFPCSPQIWPLAVPCFRRGKRYGRNVCTDGA